MRGICAVIPAAGSGERLGHSEPKAYAPLDGIPLVAWTLAAMEAASFIDDVIVVTQRREIERTWRLAVQFGFSKLSQVVEGGADRQTSVLNGMRATSAESEVILVHDAARPLTPLDVFERCAAAAAQHGSASAALPVADTLRQGKLEANVGTLVERSSLVRIQTPQAVRASIVRENFEACSKLAASCTDDSSMIEQAAGIPAFLVQGSELSLKITRAEDLALVEALARAGYGVRPGAPVSSNTSHLAGLPFCVGLGYDVHSFDESRPMKLAGLQIPDSPGLSGHSDADVVIHALCDAILGAVGERDIGYHFPNHDPAYSGIDSACLLERVVDIAAGRGWRPAQVDISVVAEKPKLEPHVQAMRQRLSELTGVPSGRVAIKATTNEKMGFVGRGEGIACFALVTLSSTGR